VTGWEIRQALAAILAHDDRVIETALVWLPPGDVARLAALAGKLEER